MTAKLTKMNPRRNFLLTLALLACGALARPASAAITTVEIVAMAHPPVAAALKPLRDWLAGQGKKVRVVEIDAESPAGIKRFQSAGMTGHIPILILIDGQYRFTNSNRSTVEFVKFPDVTGSPPGMRGNWVTDDVRQVIAAHKK